MTEESLEPDYQSIHLARAKQVYLNNFVYLDYLLISDFFYIKCKQSRNFTHYEVRIDHSDNRLMRDPFLHRDHRNAIDIIPVVNLMIRKVLILYQ